MSVINIIKSCKSERQLLKYIRYRLEKCIMMSDELNEGVTYIGDNVDINPNYKINEFSGYYDINPFWEGFIPPGVKIVYGVEKGFACHAGYYYYMNDFDYLIEFVNYIKGEEIRGENDIITAVHNFMRQYFINPLEKNKREQAFQLIMDNDGMYYPPSRERTIGDFKGRTMARCTEFGATAQNLLTFMGIDSIYVHDVSHAYNLVTFKNGERAIVDYSRIVRIYDGLTKTKRTIPFIGELNDNSDEYVLKLINNEVRLEFNEYAIYTLGNIVAEEIYSKKRTYGVGGIKLEEKRLVK